MNLQMNKFFILMLTTLLLACVGANAHEVLLKSDGSLFADGKQIELADLEKYSHHPEIIITVDIDVPYKEVSKLMTDLENMGFEKVGLKANVDELKRQ